MHILGWIIFGALTGWLASQIVHKRGQGCLVNIALGLVGAVVGGFVFQQVSGNFSYETNGVIVSMIVAVIGAGIVLLGWNAISRR